MALAEQNIIKNSFPSFCRQKKEKKDIIIIANYHINVSALWEEINFKIRNHDDQAESVN